jgi:hypothetical protein
VVISVETAEGVARFESSLKVLALGVCSEDVCPPPAPTCAPAYSWKDIYTAQPGSLQRLTSLRRECEYYPPPPPPPSDTAEHWYALALAPGQTVAISMTSIPTDMNYDIMLYKADNLVMYVASSSFAHHVSESIIYTPPLDGTTGKQPYYLRVFLTQPGATLPQPKVDYYRLLVNDASHALWLPHIAMTYGY